MTAPFVASLRARPETLTVGDAGANTWTLRVQSPEVWDAVRIQAPPSTPVRSVKERALSALVPETRAAGELVMKLNGFEILDEDASLAEVGALDGSTFLLTHRRRRPVR